MTMADAHTSEAYKLYDKYKSYFPGKCSFKVIQLFREELKKMVKSHPLVIHGIEFDYCKLEEYSEEDVLKNVIKVLNEQ